MRIDYQSINIGDRLVRTKGGIMSKHHALYAGFWQGQHVVAENQNGHGVRYILLEQFLKEGKLERVDYNHFDKSSQKEIIRRIEDKLGSSYNVIFYNCEHFVNEILTGIAESKQVKTGSIVLGITVGPGLLLAGLTSED